MKMTKLDASRAEKVLGSKFLSYEEQVKSVIKQYLPHSKHLDDSDYYRRPFKLLPSPPDQSFFSHRERKENPHFARFSTRSFGSSE
jgi:hypothetical protein